MSTFAKQILQEQEKPLMPVDNTGGEGGDNGGAAGSEELDETGKPKVIPPVPPVETPKPADSATPSTPPAKIPLEKVEGAPAESGDEDDVDDAKILAALKKRGMDISSLEDIKPKPKELTPEEKEAAKEELKEQSIQFGLKNKLFKTTDLEEFAAAQKRDPQEVALEEFAVNYKKSYPEATDEDVKDAFSDFFGLDLEDGHFRKTLMSSEMKRIADMNLRSKFPQIMGVEEDYQENIRVEQSARTYKERVDKAFADIKPELKITLDGQEYSFPYRTDSIKALKEQFLSAVQFDAFGQEAPDEKVLMGAISESLNAKDMRKAIEVIAKAHADKILLDHQAGRKGIIPERVSSGGSNEHTDSAAYNGFAKDIINQNN